MSQYHQSIQKGFFITFEGIEGSGKTTQAEKLYRTLLKRGYPTLFTREPGGTEISEKIRAVLLDRAHTEMASWTELFLYLASRAQLLHQVILPSLKEGKIVLSDRFSDSTLAYQGGGRGLDRKKIKSLNALYTEGREPDLTFLFDIPPEEGIFRATHRRGNPNRASQKDRIESEKETFFRKVREEYRRIAGEDPGRVRVINGRKKEEEIEEEVLRIVEDRLEKLQISPLSGRKR